MASARRAATLLAPPSHVRTSASRSLLQPSYSTPLAWNPSSRTYATYNPNIAPPQPPPSSSSSVNDAEVTHFNALASSWWDSHGSSRLLHLMNPLRHRFLRQCLDSDSTAPPEPTALHPRSRRRRLLDIGCGGGIFAESAARNPWLAADVTAIDPSPEVIAVARRHQRHDPALLAPGRLTYHNLALEALPSPTRAALGAEETRRGDERAGREGEGEGYDIISVFEVIEHVRDPAPFLREALARLRPGGWLVGSTIARTTTSWLTTKFVAEDLLRLVPRGTHEWKQYIQPHELRDWARLQEELDVGVGGVGWQVMGVVYIPGLGWKEVQGSEDWGNYFFGVRKKRLGE